MNEFIYDETLKQAKKIAILNVGSYKYMVYTIFNFSNYILHVSKMVKINNIINLVEIDSNEKELILNIIKCIMKIKDVKVLNEYLISNNISLE